MHPVTRVSVQLLSLQLELGIYQEIHPVREPVQVTSMPPPKKEQPTPAASVQAQQDAASDGIDFYELPKALVQRIAKSSIPENSKLQKETVTALQKGSTVFINYLAATAHDIATSRQHKTVSASDVLKALEVIQFGDMVDPLQNELQIFRENAKNPKKTNSANKSAGVGAASGTGDSVSARSNLNPKGKGKVGEVGHGPSPLSTSVSATDGDANMENTEGQAAREGESGEDEEGEGGGADEEEDELADDIDVGEETEDEGEGERGEEQDELVDRMAVDEEDIKHDAKPDLGARTEHVK